MDRISELLKKMRVLTWAGINPADLIDAMHIIEQSQEISDKRVLSCSVVRPGNMLLVKTGEGRGACNGGGCLILLEKLDCGWAIAEVEAWLS